MRCRWVSLLRMLVVCHRTAVVRFYISDALCPTVLLRSDCVAQVRLCCSGPTVAVKLNNVTNLRSTDWDLRCQTQGMFDAMQGVGFRLRACEPAKNSAAYVGDFLNFCD